MKKSRIYLIIITLCHINFLSAITTKEIPNARTLFKKEKDSLNKIAILGTFLPIPIISTIFQAPSLWKDYLECRKTYKLFKSVNIFMNQKNFTDKQVLKSQKKLEKFLNKIKKESYESSKGVPLFHFDIKSQKILDNKVKNMTVNDLVTILNKADQIIPKLLGDPRFSYAKYDLSSIRYSLRVSCSFPDQKYIGVSIFEKSIEDELNLEKNKEV